MKRIDIIKLLSTEEMSLLLSNISDSDSTKWFPIGCIKCPVRANKTSRCEQCQWNKGVEYWLEQDVDPITFKKIIK